MILTEGELIRLLEYIPKETAPDLHKKILGKLVSSRHFHTIYGSALKRKERAKVQEAFISSLSEEELEAWQDYSDSMRVDEDVEH